eukprot:g8159.t1
MLCATPQKLSTLPLHHENVEIAPALNFLGIARRISTVHLPPHFICCSKSTEVWCNNYIAKLQILLSQTPWFFPENKGFAGEAAVSLTTPS